MPPVIRLRIDPPRTSTASRLKQSCTVAAAKALAWREQRAVDDAYVEYPFHGPLLERMLGHGEFLLLYIGSELAAHALTLWQHHDNPQYAAVGASGAISGVVFAFCLFFPFERLYIFFALPMPAILFAVVYVWGSIYAMRQEEQRGGMTGGIAHEAHLGGALGGVLLTVLLEPRVVGHFLNHFGL